MDDHWSLVKKHFANVIFIRAARVECVDDRSARAKVHLRRGFAMARDTVFVRNLK